MRHATTSPGKAHLAVFATRREGQRLRLSVLGVVLVALAIGGVGCTAAVQQNKAEATDLAALPQEVRAALDRAARVYAQPLSGVTWLKVYRLSGSDHPIFQVQGTNGRGNKTELEVTSAGRIIEVEEHGIPLHEVPSAVIEALKANRPEFNPTQVEAIYQAEAAQPSAYGFEGKDAAGSKTEVYLSADGRTFLN